MYDSMQYDPIQGQVAILESRKSFYFQKLAPPPFTLGDGKWPVIRKLRHII